MIIHANVGNNSKPQIMNILDKIYLSIHKYHKFISITRTVTYSFFMFLMLPLFATILFLFTLACYLFQFKCNFFVLIIISSIIAGLLNISIAKEYFYDYKIRSILSREYQPKALVFLSFIFVAFTISIIGFVLAFLILTYIN
jgi:hypothetical protein